MGAPAADSGVDKIWSKKVETVEKQRPFVRLFLDKDVLAAAVADRICSVSDSCRSEGRPLVLGLASGASPGGVYRELALRVQTGELDLSGCLVFCLDEYYPMQPEDARSYVREMSSVAAELGIPRESLRIPRGDTPREEVESHCQEYEEAIRLAGGIDFQILGVGRSGHVGFNEPYSTKESRTRLVRLDERTRQDAAPLFGGLDHVPRDGITMGVGTVLDAREVALIAIGAHKAETVQRLVEESPSSAVPASFLRTHERAAAYLDEDAAWLLGEVVADEREPRSTEGGSDRSEWRGLVQRGVEEEPARTSEPTIESGAASVPEGPGRVTRSAVGEDDRAAN